MGRLSTAVLITFSAFLLVHAQSSDSSDGPNQPAGDSSIQTAEPAMTLERIEDVLLALDPNAQTNGSRFLLTVEDIQVFVITDVDNDRMRVMTPIRPREGISSAEMTRMMQANFDSALDARYAIAQDTLWSVFIHPFSPLEKNQLITAIGQVINLVTSYGTVYSGGALNFGGGDSEGINRQLIDRLLDKGKEV